MANFCAQCGNPLQPETSACPICGTLTSSQTGLPAQPSSPVHPALLPTRSAITFRILLTVVILVAGAVLVAGGLLGYKVYSVARSVRNSMKTDDNSQVSITTEDGTLSTGQSDASEADLGVPLYPGATATPGGVQVKNTGGVFFTATFKTPDRPEAVALFYREKLPEADETASNASRATVFKAGGPHNHSVISITPVSESDRMNTSIVIMHTQSIQP